MVDLKRFTPKSKPVTYTGALIKLYNWKNHGPVHEIHEMVKLEKICTLIAENPRNLGAHWIIEIFSVLRNTHMVPRNQDKVMFYVNNYID